MAFIDLIIWQLLELTAVIFFCAAASLWRSPQFYVQSTFLFTPAHRNMDGKKKRKIEAFNGCSF